MENGYKENSDQADELRKLLDEVEGAAETSDDSAENGDAEKEYNAEVNDQVKRQVDILELPPRKEIHSNKKTPMKFKLNHALIRFIFVIVSILAVLAIAYYFLGNDWIGVNN